MVRVLAFVLALGILNLTPGFAAAASGSSQQRSVPRMVSTSFHLRVAVKAAPGTTFWVAYGPLDGKWGLIRLHRSGKSVYSGSRVLPTSGRTVFSFIAGRGTMRSRMGVVPGNPVTTIRSIGPITIWPHGVPTVLWRVSAAKG